MRVMIDGLVTMINLATIRRFRRKRRGRRGRRLRMVFPVGPDHLGGARGVVVAFVFVVDIVVIVDVYVIGDGLGYSSNFFHCVVQAHAARMEEH